MKKLFALLSLVIITVACSTDENIDSNIDIATLELENYKGLFTTLDGLNRGTLEVTLSNDGRSATGNLTLSTGEIISIFTEQVTDLENTKEITFTSNDLSFTMMTIEEGETLEIDTVDFRGSESSILTGRNTERTPLTTVTGTFACNLCPAPLDNMSTQTFNLMFSIAAGNDNNVMTQTTLAGTVYIGNATQSSCIATGNQTTCNLNSGTMAGVTGTAFNPGGGNVTWSGTHVFDNTLLNTCSTTTGDWQWDSSTIGLVRGTFMSDQINNCPPALITLYSENFQAFTGLGFAPMPAAGQLDSDIVIANGFSDGTLDFGGIQEAGDYARGLDVGGEVNTGGVYAFDVDAAGNIALGIQPITADFTPGEFDFRIQNTTGMELVNFAISYDIYVNNDQERANSLNFSYSLDNITYTPVSELDFTSTEVSDALGFVRVIRSGNFITPSLADGDFIYIRFEGDDVSGSNSRDEFAIDNILLQGS